MRALVIALYALAAPAPAAAQLYDAPPAVSARRLSDGAGAASASMDVRAPPEAVWSVLTDCANARRFMRDLISCRILERGEGWELREHRVRGWLLKPVMRNVSRIDLTPNRRFAFRRVEGDWSRSEGEWLLTPIDGGRGTHVSYRVEAAVSTPIPAGLSRARLVRAVRDTLADLRREAEARLARQ